MRVVLSQSDRRLSGVQLLSPCRFQATLPRTALMHFCWLAAAF
jgi:hypothetical protein